MRPYRETVSATCRQLDDVGFCGCGMRVWSVGAVFAACCFAVSRSCRFSFSSLARFETGMLDVVGRSVTISLFWSDLGLDCGVCDLLESFSDSGV